MSEHDPKPLAPRKRSLTALTLDWLAERLRRSERIKGELASGTYAVDSKKIAASLINSPRDSK
jgi:hypothetical protein